MTSQGRTTSDPTAFVAAIKAAVWEIDPAQPLSDVSLLERFLAGSLGPQRLRSVLLATFAGIGLLIAVIGIYAVTARSVVERTREVGVRLALGGQPRRVWWALAGRALRAFAAGIVAGAGGALAVAALLAGVFPEIASTPRIYAAPDSFGLPKRYAIRASDGLLWIGTRESLQALLDARAAARARGVYDDPTLRHAGLDFLGSDSSSVISRTGKWLTAWVAELGPVTRRHPER